MKRSKERREHDISRHTFILRIRVSHLIADKVDSTQHCLRRSRESTTLDHVSIGSDFAEINIHQFVCNQNILQILFRFFGLPCYTDSKYCLRMPFYNNTRKNTFSSRSLTSLCDNCFVQTWKERRLGQITSMQSIRTEEKNAWPTILSHPHWHSSHKARVKPSICIRFQTV